MGRWTDRQVDKETERKRGRQTDRLIDGQTGRQTDRQIALQVTCTLF